MKEKIKNATILGKTVRRDKAKMLKRVQDDMGRFNGDMEVSRHCEQMRSNPAYYFARSAEKNLLGCSRLTGLRLSVSEFHSFTLKPSPSARNPLSPLTFHFSPKDTLTSHFSQRRAFTLAEGATHVARQHNKREFAFTLAEVLITLGIIGVVAAMTMPVLIAKIEKNILKNQFKKMYSLLSTAIQKTNYDSDFNMDCLNSNYIGCRTFFKDYFSKNLKVVKTCDGNGLRDGCLPDYNWKLDAGCAGYNPERLNANSYVAVLNDGSLFFTYSNYINEAFGMIAFDVNGKKGPNKIGEDVFSIRLNKIGGNIVLGQVYEKGIRVSDCMSPDGYIFFDGENIVKEDF